MILNLEHSTLNEKKIVSKKYQKQISEISAKLHNPDHSAGTTWVDWPVNYDKKEFAKIQKIAKTVSSNSDALLVIGIGGSYLGAKAGLDMLLETKSKVEVIFIASSGINTCFHGLYPFAKFHSVAILQYDTALSFFMITSSLSVQSARLTSTRKIVSGVSTTKSGS